MSIWLWLVAVAEPIIEEAEVVLVAIVVRQVEKLAGEIHPQSRCFKPYRAPPTR